LFRQRSCSTTLRYEKLTFSGSNSQAFYMAAKAVFRKVGRTASEEVTLQLVLSKCVSVLLYGLEARACSLNASGIRPLDFVIDQFLQRIRIARNADRCNSHSRSVCLSVSQSRFGVLSRRMKIRSCGLQHPVGQSF